MKDATPRALSESNATPTPGNGVVEIILPDEVIEMSGQAVDLSPNVANALLNETIGNIQANNRDGRNVSTMAMGVLQMAAARNFDELGAVESRSTSGVMATPIASPTDKSA
jgi:hypothetical protein